MAGLRIATMGATIVPDESIYCELEDMGQVYRRGSIFTAKGRGATIGRNLIIRQSGNVDRDRYLYQHETGHYKDMQLMGAYKFYARTAREYRIAYKAYGRMWALGVHNTYGTLENMADYYAYQNLGYIWKGSSIYNWNYGAY